MNASIPDSIKMTNSPANTVRIRVGLRQSTYFLPKDVKELIQNIDRQIEKRRRDLQKSLAKAITPVNCPRGTRYRACGSETAPLPNLRDRLT